MNNLESTVLNLAAILLIGGVLVAIADTPFYPFALGIEVVVIFYFVSSGALTGFNASNLFQWLKPVQPTTATNPPR